MVRIASFGERISEATDRGIPIAGSIGRSAIIGHEILPTIRHCGTPRDIDIVNVAQHAGDAAGLTTERGYDATWLRRFVASEEDGQAILIYPGKTQDKPSEAVVSVAAPRLEEALTPAGYGRVNGRYCIVLNSQVQLAIDTMFGTVHPKNISAIEELKHLVDNLDEREKLDPEILQPFSDYAEEVKGLWRRRVYVAVHGLHHKHIPPEIARAAHPLIKNIARGRLI